MNHFHYFIKEFFTVEEVEVMMHLFLKNSIYFKLFIAIIIVVIISHFMETQIVLFTVMIVVISFINFFQKHYY